MRPYPAERIFGSSRPLGPGWPRPRTRDGATATTRPRSPTSCGPDSGRPIRATLPRERRTHRRERIRILDPDRANDDQREPTGSRSDDDATTSLYPHWMAATIHASRPLDGIAG